MRFSTFGLALGCLALVLVGDPASAGTGAANASDVGLTPLKLREYNPLKVKNQGPDRAEGVVYFIDGLDSYHRRRDEYTATYPYVYGLNTHFGWDVIAAKFPNAERYSFRAIPRSSIYIIQRLRALKAQGYKKVILAGQSWGAWVSVDVAKRYPADPAIDALLLTAPANYGTRQFAGKPNPYFERNKTEYVENIKSIRTPTAAIFFRDDEFDPGGRGPITRDTLENHAVAGLIIDQPPDFIGHGAGWQLAFDYAYGPCLDAFLKKPRDATCDTLPAPSNKDTRSVMSEKDVLSGGARPITLSDLTGKTLINTSPSGQVTVEKYAVDSFSSMSDSTTFTGKMRADGDNICFLNACNRIYQLGDGGFISFSHDGNWTGRMVSAE